MIVLDFTILFIYIQKWINFTNQFGDQIPLKKVNEIKKGLQEATISEEDKKSYMLEATQILTQENCGNNK